MATLTTSQQAPIMDDTTGSALSATGHTATSSNEAVVAIATVFGSLYCVAQGTGSANVTATRNSDGGTGTMTVTVEASPLTISLGPAGPKG